MQPGVCALHHPAPRFRPGVTFGPGFLAAGAQMQGEAELPGQGARLVIVEPLVETEMLGLAARRLGPPEGNGGEGLAHQLVVIAVGAADHRPERDPAAVGQQ